MGGPLGEKVGTPDEYAPEVLYPVPRTLGRSTLGLTSDAPLPFAGEDVWNAQELSWLTETGWPRRGWLEMRVPLDSINLVESKSLKLYLNSLNFERMGDEDKLLETIRKDVSKTVGVEAEQLKLKLLTEEPPLLSSSKWTCVDKDAEASGANLVFEPDTNHLSLESGAQAQEEVEEFLVSHLLRTLCPVTNQPDWGSVLIHYRGPKIDRTGLARYVCSLRSEIGFHENAVERLFLAVAERCRPSYLCVCGRFFRRGGIDINPVRVTQGFDVIGEPQVRVPGQ
mmetsp:Transcript_16244/g.53076  ORF Transcript_16244/g.53076 Transcript_16244/m.53076 type:complete len:282 (+) Transcript_16244:171-1016(+)